MDSLFARALLPAPPRVVLGRRLRPFCLWHAFLFEALELDDAEPTSIAELAALVRVATLPPLLWRAFTRRDRLWRQWQHWRLARAPAHFYLELDRWRAWRDEGFAGPEMFEPENGVPLKCPWQLFRAAQLMRYGRLSRREAWGLPLAEVLWICAGLAEANGTKIDLVTEQTRAAMREAGYEV